MSDIAQARGIISVAKGGIKIAGIDERILIPNIVGLLKAEREACAQIAEAIDSKRGNEAEIARAIRERG